LLKKTDESDKITEIFHFVCHIFIAHMYAHPTFYLYLRTTLTTVTLAAKIYIQTSP